MSLAPLLDRLTHHVHILEMKAKAIGSPEQASVPPAVRSDNARLKNTTNDSARIARTTMIARRGLSPSSPRLLRAATRVRARLLGATEQIRHPCGE